MMIRSFLSVGQGAFYRECFRFDYSHPNRRINVVYDCGSLTSDDLIRRRIRDEFEKDEIVNAVFISHFDVDHCNGLNELFNRCDVKNLFLPLVTKKELFLSHLAGLAHTNGTDSLPFLSDLSWFLKQRSGRPRIFLVSPPEYQEDDFVFFEGSEMIRAHNVSQNVFEDENVTEFPYNDWVFYPYNFQSTKRADDFEQELRNRLGVTFDWRSVVDPVSFYRQHDKIIKAALKEVEGSVNSNSMTLFSGTLAPHVEQVPCFCNRRSWSCRYLNVCGHCCESRPNGCLYTGDYEAQTNEKWCALKDAYEKYWDRIGCLQLPHHGAKNGFHQEMMELDAYFVASAGYSSKFGHPNSRVIRELLCHRCDVQIVTEMTGSEASFRISF